MKRDLEYWYDHTSMLGFARVIRSKLPWYIRKFVNVYADTKRLDNRNGVVRVYYSFKSADTSGNKFCYEFTVDDFEMESNGKPTITKYALK